MEVLNLNFEDVQNGGKMQHSQGSICNSEGSFNGAVGSIEGEWNRRVEGAFSSFSCERKGDQDGLRAEQCMGSLNTKQG